MERIKPHTLSGFMELLPAPQQQMEAIMDVLRTTYSLTASRRSTRRPLKPPTSCWPRAAARRKADLPLHQGRRRSRAPLRPDRAAGKIRRPALQRPAFPFRRYQIGKVYRGERAQRGRFREFYQADIDIIGDGKLSIVNEADIPSIIYKTFTTLGLKRFQIRVNNRKILNGFYAMQGLTEQAGDIMRTVDKLDKIGPEKVTACSDRRLRPDRSAGGGDPEIHLHQRQNAEVLAALEGYRGQNDTFDLGLDELRAVTRYLAAFGVPEANFAVDLTIARGLDYYTGTVYETTLIDHPEIGSVCSGGRRLTTSPSITPKSSCRASAFPSA